MINLNLLNSRIIDANAAQGMRISSAETGEVSKEEQKAIAKKIIIMFIGVLGLFAYEKYNVGNLEEQRNEINQQVQAQVAEIEKLKMNSGKAEEIKVEIEKLEEKLKILLDLSKKRLKELKALDYLQSSIPDGVWLKSIDYDGTNVKFTGAAINDKELGNFTSILEASNYFQSVILLKAVEATSTNSGSAKEFEISSVMGVQE